MHALRRNRLTTAVQVSLLLLLPGFAAAQDAPPPATPATEAAPAQPATLERVAVTGSRI
jgi:iron complex outermembrane receptor protein